MTRPIRLTDLYRLRGAGLLPSECLLEAAWRIRDRHRWNDWATAGFLALGLGHALVGLLLFLIHHWPEMPAYLKFAVIEVGVAVSVFGSLLAGVRTMAGQILLVTATACVGVLLVVIEQVYPTGTRAYEMCVAWLLLVLPWAMFLGAVFLWACWLTVMHAAIALYWLQVHLFFEPSGGVHVVIGLGATIVLCLEAQEGAVKAGMRWLALPWLRRGLLVVSMGCFAIAACAVLLGLSQDRLPVPVFLIALGAGLALYLRVLPDFSAVMILASYGGLFLAAAGYLALDAVIGFVLEGAVRFTLVVSLTSLWCLFIALLLGALYRMLRRHMTLEP